MKQKLLLLLGALFVALGIQAAAPASYLSFRINGNDSHIDFGQFSYAVPAPFDLGTVQATSDGKPNIGITGYQVVMPDNREGREYEQSHYMQVYIGVYDKSITGNAYYDQENERLYIQPTGSSTPVSFGHLFSHVSGPWNTNLSNMTVSEFVWDDGMVDNFVLPAPLVYDAQSNSYTQGQYQEGHSYVIAVHFKEIVQCANSDSSWSTDWHYPEGSGSTGEYTSFLWSTDRTKECLLASFDYGQNIEAATSASVTLSVNGEEKQYNLLGTGQQPIDLGTIYRTEVTGAHGNNQWTVPALGFVGFTLESAEPVSNSAAVNNNGASMTFTTVTKSYADQFIGPDLEVDARDYKTANFGNFPAILCATKDGLAKLSENWTYDAYPADVWVNWIFSETTPVYAGWANDGAYGYNSDGVTYTLAFYFSEYGLGGLHFIHRNGRQYYKFNFTYSDSELTGIEDVKADAAACAPYYTLDGRRLTGKPAKSGLYLKDGKKMIIK